VKVDLYHRIADVESAAVRKLIVELGIQEKFRFRNIDASETARTDLISAIGKDLVPTLIIEQKKILSGQLNIESFLRGE
jgi:hypothetical protein